MLALAFNCHVQVWPLLFYRFPNSWSVFIMVYQPFSFSFFLLLFTFRSLCLSGVFLSSFLYVGVLSFYFLISPIFTLSLLSSFVPALSLFRSCCSHAKASLFLLHRYIATRSAVRSPILTSHIRCMVAWSVASVLRRLKMYWALATQEDLRVLLCLVRKLLQYELILVLVLLSLFLITGVCLCCLRTC